MLEVSNLTVAYSLHRALEQVELQIGQSEIVVILGANGAGKSSLLKAIAGIVPALPGKRIVLSGHDISALPPHRIVEAGLALVPEGRGIFGDLTVRENLRLGAYPERSRATEREILERVLTLFPRLAERLGQTARTMSGGEQQMVAIARALMSGPKLLLLDEPSLGLSPLLVKDLFAALHMIKARGQSLILVEQSVRQSLRLADYVYVLENGRIVRGGRPAEIEGDEAIQKAYLGLAGRRPQATSAATLAMPAGRLPETTDGMRRVRAAGGFRSLYARSVGAVPGAEAATPKEERAMTGEPTFFANAAGGGFFHPFARSVGHKPTAPVCPASAPAPQAAPAVRREKIPTTGGFINPRAMNPQARPERL